MNAASIDHGNGVAALRIADINTSPVKNGVI
jgi:hypothetical protein